MVARVFVYVVDVRCAAVSSIAEAGGFLDCVKGLHAMYKLKGFFFRAPNMVLGRILFL
jgi:hypothetical protein